MSEHFPSEGADTVCFVRLLLEILEDGQRFSARLSLE